LLKPMNLQKTDYSAKVSTEQIPRRPIDYERFAYCSKCGRVFEKSLMWCPNCRTRLRHHPRNAKTISGIIKRNLRYERGTVTASRFT
jgi:predicted amidophosphoribosyltransferase